MRASLYSLTLSVVSLACTEEVPESDTSVAPDTVTIPSFESFYSEPLDFGATWCGMSTDGTDLVISGEVGGEIWAGPYDQEVTALDRAEIVATRTDAGEQQIADHAQLYRNGRHLITFSVAGEGQGGDLFLLSLDEDLERQSLEQLLDDEPPTNDMFMVSNETGVGIGVFEPGVGHRVLALDDELILRDTIFIGGDDAVHANGASGLYLNDRVHLLAPFTLAPGSNDRFLHMEIGGDWELLTADVVLKGSGDLGMVSALSYLPEYGFFVAHYADGMSADGGDVTRLIFDEDWNLLDQRVVLEGTWTRVRSEVIDDRFYLCADGGGSIQVMGFDLVDPS